MTGTLLTVAISLNRSFYGGGLQRHWHALRTRAPHTQLQLPWAPLLTEEEMQRGIAHYGGGARLRRVAAKLLGGRSIKVFTLGGSVTFGHGVGDGALCYASRFFHFINASFPHRDHVLVNQGMPAATSPVTSPCLDQLVAQDADLVVIEFTVNDSPVSYLSPGKHSYERLIRQLLALGGAPAVVLLHHYPWWKANGDGAEQGLFYREPEGQLDMFSHYYDVPSLSLRSAAWRQMQAGIDGFKVDKLILGGNRNTATDQLIPTADAGAADKYFYLDTIHPGPSGHQVLAEMLAGLLTRALGEAAAGVAPAVRQDVRMGGLPPPMIPNYEDYRPSFCAMLEAFKPMVKAFSGFEYTALRPDLPAFVEQKWGWAGTQPGEWLDLEVDTRPKAGSSPRGAANASGSSTQVYLSYLQSHVGMGTARVSCTAGCTCAPSALDSTSKSRASVFKIHAFEVSRHPQCRFRVTITDRAGQVPQDGQKVMLSALMVTHLFE